MKVLDVQAEHQSASLHRTDHVKLSAAQIITKTIIIAIIAAIQCHNVKNAKPAHIVWNAKAEMKWMKTRIFVTSVSGTPSVRTAPYAR